MILSIVAAGVGVGFGIDWESEGGIIFINIIIISSGVLFLSIQLSGFLIDIIS